MRYRKSDCIFLFLYILAIFLRNKNFDFIFSKILFLDFQVGIFVFLVIFGFYSVFFKRKHFSKKNIEFLSSKNLQKSGKKKDVIRFIITIVFCGVISFFVPKNKRCTKTKQKKFFFNGWEHPPIWVDQKKTFFPNIWVRN